MEKKKRKGKKRKRARDRRERAANGEKVAKRIYEGKAETALGKIKATRRAQFSPTRNPYFEIRYPGSANPDVLSEISKGFLRILKSSTFRNSRNRKKFSRSNFDVI